MPSFEEVVREASTVLVNDIRTNRARGKYTVDLSKYAHSASDRDELVRNLGKSLNKYSGEYDINLISEYKGKTWYRKRFTCLARGEIYKK